ncbi:MAG TPA: hypothetical protein VGV59_03945 [Pyrinomonadaceae bacterium]|nr:hypothetical protein [Pyrinomonadaceae bacterium]
MASPHDSRAGSPQPLKLLAVSFCYPPLAYPRSVQVARLLKYLEASTVLVCADEDEARKDATLEPDAEAHLARCLRVPFAVSGARRLANRLSYRLHRPLWNRLNLAPDKYGAWKSAALGAVAEFARGADGTDFDALVTFAQPFTGHLLGLELKRRFGLPWLAHFSDPWVDSPFNRYDETARRLNLALEREVCETADLLAFTSAETIDLVLSKYPDEWRGRARVLPQSFDPALFERRANGERDSKLVVRYVGNFYGERTPAPLVRTLRAMLDADARALDDVRFELVGVTDEELVRRTGVSTLPDGLIETRPPVEYRESLRLMAESDGLLVIDAPADVSVFLPSKLIDYAGAGRPVLGLSPKGAAAALIDELGGLVADPSDDASMLKATTAFLALLRQRRRAGRAGEAWGAPDVRGRYEATRVAASFAEMLRGMLNERKATAR